MAILCGALALGGCSAPLFRQAPAVGDPVASVTAKMGQPTNVYPLPDGQLFEYATGPMGQFTWMARIGADGRLQSYEQVLTGEKFAAIRIGKATKDEVLRTVGRPAEHSRVASHDYEVWSYRYREAGVWNSLMHVHFDAHGVVQQMLNGPDPLFEVRDRNMW
ncbi:MULTISPECIES: outer membrane protein assembly factor BamE [unclassified Massilia]|uniref:outer membrane protein assembly factor BamE n=1 Tax=unclassified Massilia TaxID=2609279 RepID=UPI001E58E795|nr:MULTISPECIES: outer membrane protein assembly factor BamE [unclassified Massilia]